jgi:hypothetical protein
MADEVQFTDEQWETVAKAAETFAAVLDTERSKLRLVLKSNWAGACAEGEMTMLNLQSLLTGESNSFSQVISSEAEYLTNIASQCRASQVALAAADEASSEKFSR